MVSARRHPDADFGSGHRPGGGYAGGPGSGPDARHLTSPNRLNLLLSYAGWEPDPWVERLPRLLEPMGVLALKAASGRQASEVLRTNPIHIAVVDLGLPLEAPAAPTPTAPEFAEGGPRLLELLARLDEPPPVVVVKRGRTHRDDSREIAAALKANAFAVIDRPRDPSDLNTLLDVLRRCLTRFYQGRWPGSDQTGGNMPGGRWPGLT